MEWRGMLRRHNPVHDRFGYPGLIAIGVAAVALGLMVRSDVAADLLEAILELIGWVGIVGGAAIAIAGAVAYANERGWLNLPEESGGGVSTPAEAGMSPAGESGVAGAVDEALAPPPRQAGSLPNRGTVRRFLTVGLFLFVLATFSMTWVDLDFGRDDLRHSGLEALTD